MVEQYIPGKCPKCDHEMSYDDIIKVGEYPIGGYRQLMKPNQKNALIYQCPICFEKSCHHINDDMVETYKRFISN